MESAIQRKTINIDRGLFLLRYAAAEDAEQPPFVKVSPDKATEKNVTLILQPDHRDAVLSGPGTALVVRATAAAKLWVEVSALQADGSTAASITIEEVTQGDPIPQLPTAPNLNDFDLSDFRVLGHIARLGDLVVASQEWLAGPSAPARIEGIAVEWPSKPQDLDIRYSVKLARPQAAASQMMGLGSFAGTRGRALPIIGMILEMSGPAASNWQFVVEALFLGSPVNRLTGRRIVLSGPTEKEPLVGLRIGVQHVAAQAIHLQDRPAQSSGRVRVFRGGAKRDQTLVD
jgi:hypothetical protein